MNPIQIIVLGILLLLLLALFVGGILVNTGRHDEPETAGSDHLNACDAGARANFSEAPESIQLTDAPDVVQSKRRFYELDLEHEQLKAELNAIDRRKQELTRACERVMDEKSLLAQEIFKK